MLDLLRGFLEPIFQFIPRFSRRPTSIEHCVVDGVLGVRESRWPQIYIEFLTHVEFYPKTPQPLDLELQTLVTADGVELTLNATMSLVIVDPMSLRGTLGQDEAMFNASIVARSAIAEVVTTKSFLDLKEMIADGAIDEVIGAQIRDSSGLGLDLHRFAVEDMARTTSKRHYGLTSQSLVIA